MKIGDVVLNNNVFLAPMAGITDMAFRALCKEMGAGLVYSEMVSSKGLYYNDRHTEELMIINPMERPIALQIFGSEPEIMADSVVKKLNHRKDIDIIDINMGCPTPKIVKNGDGSALLKNPDLIGKIVKGVVEVSNKPVTVKIRTGWDDHSINGVTIAQIAEENGASMVAVHGRTREQFYSGKANWDIIKAIKEAVTIPVIGNGDVFEPEDAVRLIEHTQCDGVMIGRGSRGNPWLFKRTIALLQRGETLPPPSHDERIKMIVRHLDLLADLKGEVIAVKEMRKHIGWYTKGMKYSAELRQKINTIKDKATLKDHLFHYMETIEKE